MAHVGHRRFLPRYSLTTITFRVHPHQHQDDPRRNYETISALWPEKLLHRVLRNPALHVRASASWTPIANSPHRAPRPPRLQAMSEHPVPLPTPHSRHHLQLGRRRLRSAIWLTVRHRSLGENPETQRLKNHHHSSGRRVGVPRRRRHGRQSG
jgi:hypothetical protein